MDSKDIAQIKQELRENGYNIYVYSYPGGMFFPQHQHAQSKVHVVLNGSLKISMNGTDHILNPGDRLEIPANVPHSAEVLGDGPIVCIDATKKFES